MDYQYLLYGAPLGVVAKARSPYYNDLHNIIKNMDYQHLLYGAPL
jgi:hypothetical protein